MTSSLRFGDFDCGSPSRGQNGTRWAIVLRDVDRGAAALAPGHALVLSSCFAEIGLKLEVLSSCFAEISSKLEVLSSCFAEISLKLEVLSSCFA